MVLERTDPAKVVTEASFLLILEPRDNRTLLSKYTPKAFKIADGVTGTVCFQNAPNDSDIASKPPFSIVVIP